MTTTLPVTQSIIYLLYSPFHLIGYWVYLLLEGPNKGNPPSSVLSVTLQLKWDSSLHVIWFFLVQTKSNLQYDRTNLPLNCSQGTLLELKLMTEPMCISKHHPCGISIPPPRIVLKISLHEWILYCRSWSLWKILACTTYYTSLNLSAKVISPRLWTPTW